VYRLREADAVSQWWFVCGLLVFGGEALAIGPQMGREVTTPEAAIAHLDFTPGYPCDCKQCPYHAMCTRHASTAVTVHDFGNCTAPIYAGRGGPTELLCNACVCARQAAAQALVAASLDRMWFSGGRCSVGCETCLRVVHTLLDVYESRPI
jgi:hypothetical protein